MSPSTVGVELVESYADVAIERWQRDHSGPNRGGSVQPHSPSFCGCLTCADGRELMGMRPLIPVYARRWMTDVVS